MKIETKYNFGDEVYIVYKEQGEIHIQRDVIDEVSISKELGLHYYPKNICAEFREEELIEVDRKDLLVERIDKLLDEINE